MDLGDRISDIMSRYIETHTKLLECMQRHDLQSEKIVEVLKQLKCLKDKIDNYPLRTLERLDEIRSLLSGQEGLCTQTQHHHQELITINSNLNEIKEKLSGDEGLRVVVQQYHAELKTIIRNYQLFAAGLITLFSIIIKTLMG